MIKKSAKPEKKIIFFDWDNTLVDNWNPIFISYKKTLNKLGLKNQTRNEILKNAKYSLRDNFPKIFQNNWKKAKKIFYEEFKKIHLKKIKPIKNAEKILTLLKKKKIIVNKELKIA